MGVAIHASVVYVSEAGNNRVSMFTLCGEHIGYLGSNLGQFTWPSDIAVTEEYVIIADC